MSANVIQTTGAHQDLARILGFFLDNNEDDVGTRFVDAYEETLKFVADFPELGIPWESDERRLQNVRVKPIQGFEKYLVFYRYAQDSAYILRLFHGHQDIQNLL